MVLVLRTDPRASQAGAPKVLPPRWISVTVVDAMRGLRWGSMSSAVVSLSDCEAREKMFVMVFRRGEDVGS